MYSVINCNVHPFLHYTIVWYMPYMVALISAETDHLNSIILIVLGGLYDRYR